MKYVSLLIILQLIFVHVSAQKYANLGIQLIKPKVSDTLIYDADTPPNPLSIEAEIINYGPDTIKASDSLHARFLINGGLIIDDFITGVTLPPNSSTAHTQQWNFTDFLSWPAVGTQNDFCVTITTLGNISDTVSQNDTSCSNVLISPPLSIPISKLEKEILVYPNPNNGKFVLEIDHAFVQGSLIVYDINGRNIYNQRITTGTKKIPIQLSHIPNGLYKLNVYLDNGLATYTIRIEK